MIVLKVLLGLILILVLALFVPLVFSIAYVGEEAHFSVGYLFLRFQLYPPKEPSEKKKARAAKKKDKKPKTTKEEPEEEAKKKGFPLTFGELLEGGKTLLSSVKKSLGRLLKSIKVVDLDLQVAVAGKDAADAAMKSGNYNFYIYSAFGFFSNVLTVKTPKRIYIQPDYQAKEMQLAFSCKIKVRPIAFLAMAMRLAVDLLGTLLRTRREMKQRQNQGGVKI